MTITKNVANAILPRRILIALERLAMRIRWPGYADLPTQELFTRIYADGVWGKSADPADKFNSGSGSRADAVVSVYVEAMRGFLLSLEHKPDVVDLGCGDFRVGAALRSYCGKYTACDIVEPLIEFNKTKFAAMQVDFRVLDLSRDELPRADVVFIRQVLQHLSNQQIQGALPEIMSKYKYVVLTEHLPKTETFLPNLDHMAGPDNRLQINSGIVLTRPPFNLKVKDESCLCEVAEKDGIVRTMLYTLA